MALLLGFQIFLIFKKNKLFFLLTDIISENFFWRRVLLKKVLDQLENIDFNK